MKYNAGVAFPEMPFSKIVFPHVSKVLQWQSAFAFLRSIRAGCDERLKST